MDERYVLDAHGLLTYINGEPGADDISNLLLAAQAEVLSLHISAVNLGEVAYTIERRTSGEQVAAVLANIAQLPIEVKPVTRQRALDAAHLKARYRLVFASPNPGTTLYGERKAAISVCPCSAAMSAAVFPASSRIARSAPRLMKSSPSPRSPCWAAAISAV